MDLLKLSKLINEQLAHGDKKIVEVSLFDSDGQELKGDIELNIDVKASCEEDERDVLVFLGEEK